MPCLIVVMLLLLLSFLLSVVHCPSSIIHHQSSIICCCVISPFCQLSSITSTHFKGCLLSFQLGLMASALVVLHICGKGNVVVIVVVVMSLHCHHCHHPVPLLCASPHILLLHMQRRRRHCRQLHCRLCSAITVVWRAGKASKQSFVGVVDSQACLFV